MPTKRKTNKFSKLNKLKKQQMNYSFAVFVGWILIMWGSFYFLRKFFWQNYTVSKIIKNEDNLVAQISFPSLNEDRKVVTTHVANGEWLLVDDAANYVYESARPGEKGAVIVYGHNTPSIFANLKKLSVGDTVVLKTTNDQKLYYLVEDKIVVNSDQVSLFAEKDEKLIIYTCTGFLDSKRLVITARPLF